MRHLGIRTFVSGLLAGSLLSAPLVHAQSGSGATDPVPDTSPRAREAETPVQLFASVEAAWSASDSERLAALVDTTVVRVSVTPGTPPTTALTRSAAAFLFQDQLRLVKTHSFHLIRLDVQKKGKAVGTGLWSGDWGGRQGEREIKVVLTAMARGNRWLLTEVRAND
ncbi:MAG TPA: hypothetical protein VFP58_03835 [Candidatus Eisenbacteria bacterium]|nr:hypothetical protein [Candidatus Eisenbacteria bacterium]